MEDKLIIKQVYTDTKELEDIFNYLNNLEIEYHKEYKGMYGRNMKVPRGQASFILNDKIHYNYKVSGGSPPNKVMDEKLKEITKKINEVFNTNFNTILMNVYKNGLDNISLHKDKEVGWVKNTGFLTLSFGAERDFQIKEVKTNKINTILHKNGMGILMDYPMNDFYLHGVPVRKKVKDTRISLTFREIEVKS